MLPGIGVFGTSDFGLIQVLVPFLRSNGFQVEAIWGRTLKSAEEVAAKLNITFYTNKVDDVLLRKDVSLVFIICQPDLHAQIAVKALGIGKHVLCDRPAGLCQMEVLKMVHAAQYYPSLISVISHGLRFLPAFVTAKKYIDKGFIGKVDLCDVRIQCGSIINNKYDWKCSQLMGGGVLSIIGSHIIDIISFITGQRAIRVHGLTRTFTKTTDKINGIRWIDSDDFCTFQMILNENTCVTVTMNCHMSGGFKQTIVLCGSKGRLIVEGAVLKCYNHSTNKEEIFYEDQEGIDANTGNASNNVAVSLPPPYIDGLFRMIAAMKEAFLTGNNEHDWLKEPVATAATFEDGQYVQAVIDAVKLSSTSRQWEQVLVASNASELNPLMSQLNLSNTHHSSLEALSRASTSRIPTHRKTTHESHLLWGFGNNTNKH